MSDKQAEPPPNVPNYDRLIKVLARLLAKRREKEQQETEAA